MNSALFNCPVCGLPMVHSRLRGYHCHFEQHNEQRRELDLNISLDDILSDAEIDDALDNAPPIKPSETFKERALKAMREAGKRRAIGMN